MSDGHLWAIHSEKDGRPVLRRWAPSEDEANRVMGELKSTDATPEDGYWITRLSSHQIEALKGNGFIPANA
jgi:hypothetical protein